MLMVFEKNYRQISTFADLEQACRYLPQIFFAGYQDRSVLQRY